ncbi:hypothetical protein [Chryseobacterium sp. ERMR1:04]|uniref:hypothetical protein n=1 Tax=Chryseobacterium sp. ERMR1:04 TaxID=1705393 RepID=UPI0006C84EB9|nr:hypothetical protein [Chryseobacterium sp. ERMR1:04]KPH13094.1 hypothetical protein AMQ68_11420 [Chryseobacterium sp. ERMR1:04]
MKKKFKITSNLEQKEILKKSIQNSEKENVDLYKAIFGGIGITNPGTGIGISDCGVVAVTGASAAYDRAHDTFLRA